MKTSALLAVLVLVAACTPAQVETSAREWAQSDCNRIADAVERNRCMARADGYGTAGAEQRTPSPR
jgi:predicted chitinase